MFSAVLSDALKRTKKGQLEYDNHWKEEGRTQEIVNSIKQNLSTLNLSLINSSPTKKLSSIKISNEEKSFLNNNNNNDLSTDTIDRILYKLNKTNRNESKFQFDLDFSIIDIKLQNYEQQREIEVQQKLEERQQELQEKNEFLIKKFENQMRMIQKKYLLESIRWQKKYEEEYQQLEFEVEKLNQQNSNENLTLESNKNRSNLKLKEIEEKHKLLLKQEERKRQQQIEFREKINSCKDSINLAIQELTGYVKDSPLKLSSNISEDLTHYLNILLGFSQDIEVLLLSKNEFSIEDIQLSENKFQELLKIKEEFLAKFATYIQSTNLSENDINSKNESKFISNIDGSSENDIQEKALESSAVDNNRKSDTSKSPREIYIEHQIKLVKFEELCQKFFDDTGKKQMRVSLQIYIRSIINTICNISVENLKEKLSKLLNLFIKKQFNYKDKNIKISENDYSYHFGINIAAKIIIDVATIHRNISFKLAPIIVMLWAHVPMFGSVFLSHLFLNCPYAIPYFPTKTQDQNEIEFTIVCGYHLDKNGKIESDESFYSRMFSLIELYSSTIQCNMSENHPQDINHAWKWLALVLNDKPRDIITALILDAFLSISSHKLYTIYGKQFIKLVDYIQNDFIKKIEDVTTTERQTLMKFKSLIGEIETKLKMNKGSFETIVNELTPDGLVPNYFFTKSYVFMHK